MDADIKIARMRTGNYSSYNEARSLCFLLCHLLSFYSTCVLSAESKIGDGDIIQIYVEVLRSLRQNPPDISADHLHSRGHSSDEHWILVEFNSTVCRVRTLPLTSRMVSN